jgi:hypothetical protein
MWGFKNGEYKLRVGEIEPITTNVMGFNPADVKVYLIQHYVKKFVSDLWQVSGFLQVLNIAMLMTKYGF